MAEVAQVKLTDGTVYDIVDNKKTGIYAVKGTQTAATGAWTGNIDVDALYDGLTIMYYLPYAGSGNATLNLTLNNGQTTGAKNCYYTTSRLTTHYGAGTNFIMTFWSAGSIKVNGTATTDDRWIITAQYDSNSVDQLRNTYSHPTAGANGLKQYGLFARTGNGTYDSFTTSNGTGTSKAQNTTSAFDIGKLWYLNVNGNIAAGTVTGNSAMYGNLARVDMRYTINIANDDSHDKLVANKPVFIVFLEADEGNDTHKLATPYWSQDLPSSDDGKIYVQVGIAEDWYRCDLWYYNPAYIYKDGAVRKWKEFRLASYAKATRACVALSTTNNRQYAVTPDANGVLSVNVPWSDSNNYDRLRFQKNITAGTTAIVAGNIIVPRIDGRYTHLKLGGAFRIDMPILYAGSAIAAKGTGTNNYVAMPFAIATTQSITFTDHRPVFIVGTLSGNQFTPDSTASITQTIPESEDNKHYLLLGTACSTTELYLLPDHTIFAYKGGVFGPIVNAAIQSSGGGGSAGVTWYVKNETGLGLEVDSTYQNLITSPTIPMESVVHLYQVQVASDGFRGTEDEGYTTVKFSGLGAYPAPEIWTGSSAMTVSGSQTSYSTDTWTTPVYIKSKIGGTVTAQIKMSKEGTGFGFVMVAGAKIRVVDLGPVTEVT